MTRERYSYLEPFIEAWKIGKCVQYRLSSSDEWNEIGNNVYWESPGEFRVKPEPRVWYAFAVNGKREIRGFDCEESARTWRDNYQTPIEIIKVQEVL